MNETGDLIYNTTQHSMTPLQPYHNINGVNIPCNMNPQKMPENQDYMQMNFGQSGFNNSSIDRQQVNIIKNQQKLDGKQANQQQPMSQSFQQSKNANMVKKKRNQSIGSVISEKSNGFPNHRNSID